MHHIKCALSKVLGTAEEWDYISDNPVRKTRLPRREHKSERSILTSEQLKQLLAALPEPSKSVATLLVLTGLRIGELLALRWKGVDLDARTLRITETVYDGHFDSPKTKRSVRSIPIGSESASILSALRTKAHDPDTLVVSTGSGRPLCRRNLLHRHLQPACTRTGFAEDHLAFPASLPRDAARCGGSTARNCAGIIRPRVVRGHATDISARDPSGTAPSGGGSRKASYWTQMDPNCG